VIPSAPLGLRRGTFRERSRRSDSVGSFGTPSRDISGKESTERLRQLLWDSVAGHFGKGVDGVTPSAPLGLRRGTFLWGCDRPPREVNSLLAEAEGSPSEGMTLQGPVRLDRPRSSKGRSGAAPL